MSNTNPIEDFRSALQSAGMTYAGDLIPDGKLHRFKAEGDSAAASWYVLHVTDKFSAAGFGCWKRNISEKWNNANGNGNNLSRQEWQDIKNRMNAAEAARRTEEEQLRFDAKKLAQKILSEAKPVDAHLYLTKKSVGVYGEMRINAKDELCLPLRDENGVLHSMQFIAPDKRYTGNRDKDFIFGGRVNGCFYEIPGSPEGPLIICEGYATGASIYDATGYAVMCAMFCGNLLAVGTALRKKYPDRTIIFAADNDRFITNNPGLEKATAAAKAINAAVAIPAFSDIDNEGTDFNDLQELSGKKIVQQTIDLAYKDFLMPKFEKLPPVRNVLELLKLQMPLPPLLIEGLLHQGLKGVLGSNSKARKTWNLMDIAVSVNAGVPFWRWECPTKGKVLYINFEIPETFMRRRIIEILRAKKLDDVDAENLDLWSLRGYGTALYKLLPDMIRQIAYGGYVLVILDPIYKTLGGRDENAAGDISEICNELESIAVQTGAAVVYGAHFSKGNQSGKSAIDRIGGSGVWTRDADSIITLTEHNDELSYTVDCILRNLPETKPFVVKWEYPLMRVQDNVDPEDLKKPGGRPSEYDNEDLASILSDGSQDVKVWRKLADERFGISKSQFFRMRKSLVASGRVMQLQSNGLWALVTPQAQQEDERNGEFMDRLDGVSETEPGASLASPD